MGFSTIDKEELAAYQLKDEAQTWYNKWKYNRDLGGGSVTWEIFKKAFLYRFFSMKQIEAKLEVFINLRQGGMSVKEYSIKFFNLSKYVFSFVSNARDEMIFYVMGMCENLE